MRRVVKVLAAIMVLLMSLSPKVEINGPFIIFRDEPGIKSCNPSEYRHLEDYR